jgi:murein endopeptidase
MADQTQDTDDPSAPAEPPPRGPWVGRALVISALALWGVVVSLRLPDPDRPRPPSAALSRDAKPDPEDLSNLTASTTSDGHTYADDEEPQEPRSGPKRALERALAEAARLHAEAAAGRRGDPSRGDQDDQDDTPRDPRDRLPIAPWAGDLSPPAQVTYVIKRGGAMKMVANLYKMHYHEILAYNPGVELDKELPPGTKLVVYRAAEGEPSESVGSAGDGSLVGGVPMVDGPGRILRMEPWKSYATGHNVALLDAILREWSRRYPNDRPLLVGNMAQRAGGRLKPHSTHQSGRDVDLSYPQVELSGEEYNWREMNAKNLDAARTWDLLELLYETGAVEMVLIDTALQRLLHEHALAQRRVPKGELPAWLEYPRRPGTTEAFVRHHPGHVDHLHARFHCRPEERRCTSK